MTVRQYPHTVIITGNTEDARFEGGIWIIPTPGPITEQACRYEPSTLNREVALVDGASVKYKGICYLPLSTPDIEIGVLIEIVDVIKTKSLYFQRNQMNCMLYL